METIELSRGRTRAVIVPEAGGRLHQLSIYDGARWMPLLHAPTTLSDYIDSPLVGGSYVMAPWPGRIDGGRFLWRGRIHAVPMNEEGHALHGRGAYLPWHVESRASHSCTLTVAFDDGWSWAGRIVQEIELLSDGLRQQVRIEATGDASFPAGVGWHPWFRRSVGGRANARLLVDADHSYELADMIPTGWMPRVKDARDLRGYPSLASRRLDDCYRHPRGPLRIGWGDIELTMRNSANVAHAVVYTPKEAICVEPQTCAPDAFNLAAQRVADAGMCVVDAQHPLTATTTWRWSIGRAG